MKFLLQYAKNRQRRMSIRTGGSFELLKLLKKENYWRGYEEKMRLMEESWNKQHKNLSDFPVIFDARRAERSRQVQERKICLSSTYPIYQNCTSLY